MCLQAKDFSNLSYRVLYWGLLRLRGSCTIYLSNLGSSGQWIWERTTRSMKTLGPRGLGTASLRLLAQVMVDPDVQGVPSRYDLGSFGQILPTALRPGRAVGPSHGLPASPAGRDAVGPGRPWGCAKALVTAGPCPSPHPNGPCHHPSAPLSPALTRWVAG